MELDILTSVHKHPNLVEFYGACIKDTQNPVRRPLPRTFFPRDTLPAFPFNPALSSFSPSHMERPRAGGVGKSATSNLAPTARADSPEQHMRMLPSGGE